MRLTLNCGFLSLPPALAGAVRVPHPRARGAKPQRAAEDGKVSRLRAAFAASSTSMPSCLVALLNSVCGCRWVGVTLWLRNLYALACAASTAVAASC